MRLLTVLLLVVLAMTSVIGAQDDGLNDLTFVSIQPVTEYLTSMGIETRDLAYPVLSPDGGYLAYQDADADRALMLCIHDIIAGGVDCTPLPDGLPSLQTGLAWSADGRYIATYLDPVLGFLESDIWLFELERDLWINLTDDGVSSDFQVSDRDNPPMDVVPRFHPVTNDLYFVRTVEVNGVIINTIERILAQDGNITPGTLPETVTDLSGLLPSFLPIYDGALRFLSGAVGFSPDGGRLAFINVPVADNAPQRVYLLDVTTGEVTSISNAADIIHVGKPDWLLANTSSVDAEQLAGLVWSDDGDTLLVVGNNFNSGEQSVVTNVYRLNLADGSIMPYLDFSDVPDAEIFTNTANEQLGAYDTPFFPAYIPQSDVVIHIGINNRPGGSGFVALDRAPDQTPTTIAELEYTQLDTRGSFLSPSVGDGGQIVRVVSGGYLLTFERNTP